ncbi:MAG: hypothetical protein PHW66_09410 [Gallionella sp.]|nr:hypothetical protein [Gallionella sp.]
MIPLSSAVLRGVDRAPGEAIKGYFVAGGGLVTASDVLGAAVLGQLPDSAVAAFWARVFGYTPEQLAVFMLRELHQMWPHIGQSVRCWPRLAEELERDRLIPRIVPLQTKYRREIHVSLWKVMVDMFDAGETREDIAARLARHGL